MSFISIAFLIFFVVVLGGTCILQRFPDATPKYVFLLAASYFFYGYWDWRFCFLLFFVTVTAYVTARNVQNTILFIFGVTVPLVVLGIFKYFNFFLSSFSAIFGSNIGMLTIILPVGISFYTFQALSYVIDVRRKKLRLKTVL